MWQEPLNQRYITEYICSWYSISVIQSIIQNTGLQDFREEFDKFSLLLTVPLGATPYRIEHSYDIPAVSQYVHYMFAMCYAYYGHWMSPTGPNAPLYPRYKDDNLNVVRIHQICSNLVLSKPFCLCLCYCNSVILYMTQNSLVCVPLKEHYNSFTVL